MTRRIDYTLIETSLGALLVAATPRGVCRIAFGESESELESQLALLLPVATLHRDDARLAPFAAAITDYIEGRTTSLDLPLDVRGSEFRRRVWDALARIPRGATRSYADIARSIGMPRAARAVANACAANPVAIAIPCHRVIASDGSLGGYRWGIERKRSLLTREHAESAIAPASVDKSTARIGVTGPEATGRLVQPTPQSAHGTSGATDAPPAP